MLIVLVHCMSDQDPLFAEAARIWEILGNLASASRVYCVGLVVFIAFTGSSVRWLSIVVQCRVCKLLQIS